MDPTNSPTNSPTSTPVSSQTLGLENSSMIYILGGIIILIVICCILLMFFIFKKRNSDKRLTKLPNDSIPNQDRTSFQTFQTPTPKSNHSNEQQLSDLYRVNSTSNVSVVTGTPDTQFKQNKQSENDSIANTSTKIIITQSNDNQPIQGNNANTSNIFHLNPTSNKSLVISDDDDNDIEIITNIEMQQHKEPENVNMFGVNENVNMFGAVRPMNNSRLFSEPPIPQPPQPPVDNYTPQPPSVSPGMIMNDNDNPPPIPPVPTDSDNDDGSDHSLYKLQHQYLSEEVNAVEDEQDNKQEVMTPKGPTDNGFIYGNEHKSDLENENIDHDTSPIPIPPPIPSNNDEEFDDDDEYEYYYEDDEDDNMNNDNNEHKPTVNKKKRRKRKKKRVDIRTQHSLWNAPRVSGYIGNQPALIMDMSDANKIND